MNSWPGCKEGSWPMTQSHLTGHEDINCEVAIPLFILYFGFVDLFFNRCTSREDKAIATSGYSLLIF